ncbi:hypothetical protein G7Z17_g8363 [Cylindrodendrum hubeiense]|uniref:Uncharacterized protein n=1 Tax=Cylindrodendrum hubeiense TaxID=595255 RepID=A0A9P5H1D2_9HYPO|nr:hypothetical protein G7Z17_g8363 [Cylindrodendrum hubeiense]
MATTDTLPQTHGKYADFPSRLVHLVHHPRPSPPHTPGLQTMSQSPKANPSPDRQGPRRRPFSTWVKKLTNFKSSSDADRPKRHKIKRSPKKNNPYPESGQVGNGATNDTSACTFSTAPSGSNTSVVQSSRISRDDQATPTVGRRSLVGTVSDREGSRSISAPSHGASSLAGTSRTVGGGVDSRRGEDSTFSSPSPSVRSLTTTLTTIQSMAPNGTGHGNGSNSNQNQNQTNVQFSQPFPTTSPASAIPAHLAPTGNPTTYNAATANNLLTDNASILTLASSSKRRRRRSLDTDASVRAMAPSSLWGGSRESLPLSVLSANIDMSNMPPTPGLHSSSRIGAERTSIYSATGVVPAIPGDRSSFYAKQGDGASVRSGHLGHGRANSVNGSIGGLSSPLVSPREMPGDTEKGKEKEKDKDES